MMNERITALTRQGKTVLYAGATTLNLFIDDMARTLERAYPQPIGATISLLVMV
ncbi:MULTISPECIES: hypothetical protein [unclassified Moraxella]|uniref:hypothetical protein n=1 Tax=unclassified Moraxella TaxID=2685852 RepID=UPI00359D8B2F